LEAQRKAQAIRPVEKGLIHHADRGSQYCSTANQTQLKKHGIRISILGKGNCFNKAFVETFFKTLKSNLV
jgi:putative transposase